MRTRTFATVLVFALLLVAVPATAAPSPSYTVGVGFPVSLAEDEQIQPDIDWPWIVYREDCYAGQDVYIYNLVTSQSVQITSGADAENPSISGDWVVFSDNSMTSYCSIYAYNIGTDELDLIVDGDDMSANFGNPAVVGDIVVFNDWRGEGDICGYDLTTGEMFPISDAAGDDGLQQREPEFDGTWCVYREYGSDGYTDVVAANIKTGEIVTVADGYYVDGSDYAGYTDPSVWNGIVAYEGYGYWLDQDAEYDIAIYVADLEAGTQAMISTVCDSTGRYHPSISDGLVTWHDRREGTYEVYAFDLATGVESCLVPAVWDEGTSSWTSYGGRTAFADGVVAWHDHRDEGTGTSDWEDLYAMVLSQPPVAVDDAYAGKQNQPLSVGAAAGVLANDSDPDDDVLSAGLLEGAANGTVQVNADGSFLYVPNNGFVGMDSFTYECRGEYSASAATVTITVEQSTAITEGTGAVYRFYNPVSGSHFYTPSIEERNEVLGKYLGVWFYEGFAFTALPASGCSGIHRFYNTKSGAHFYTPCDDEKASVLAKWPTIFSYDGTSFPVSTTPGAGKIAIYRFYNTKTGAHFYTASAAEADHVIATYPGLFNFEGVGFYAVSSL